MIVVNTNLIGFLYLTSNRSEQAERALRKDPEWAALPPWRSELRTVLAQCVRQSLLGLEDAQRIMSAATEAMRERQYEVTSDQELKLAAESGCSAYHCEFVTVAQGPGRGPGDGGSAGLAGFPRDRRRVGRVLRAALKESQGWVGSL